MLVVAIILAVIALFFALVAVQPIGPVNPLRTRASLQSEHRVATAFALLAVVLAVIAGFVGRL